SRIGEGCETMNANGPTFEKIRKQIEIDKGEWPSVERTASLLGVGSRNKMSELLDGKPVSYGLLKKIMGAIDYLWDGQPPWPVFSLRDLVAEKPKFPSTPEGFPNFEGGVSHGHYLDFNRVRRGNLGWGHEVLTLGRVSPPERGRFTFEGTLTNDNGSVFS